MKILIIGLLNCVSHLSCTFINKNDLTEEYQNITQYNTNHYSYYKDMLIGSGLQYCGNVVYVLFGELKKIIVHKKIYYIPLNHLTEEFIESLDAIMFTKHNDNAIEDVVNNNINMKNLFINKSKTAKSSLYKPFLICKTCVLPNIKFFKHNNMTFGNTFDMFFLQTPSVELDNTIVKSILNSDNDENDEKFNQYKALYPDNYLQIQTLTNYCHQCSINSIRIQYSEMCVPVSLTYTPKPNIEMKKTKYTLIYIGRLRQNNGMTLPFIKKLMNKLGPTYSLIILPGSFNIPTDITSIKYNPNKTHHYNKLQKFMTKRKVNFTETNLSLVANQHEFINDEPVNNNNIYVLHPVNWGEQFRYIYNCDAALNFSPNRSDNYICSVGNTKIFDYIVSGVPVVSEYGCQNNYLIPKYNIGTVIDHIGTVDDYHNAIVNIVSKKFNRKKIIKNFILNESYIKRSKDITKTLNQMSIQIDSSESSEYTESS